MAVKDYYRTLEVSHSATDTDIRQSYRRLARQYHPDVNPGNKIAEERFKVINEAYEVLSDPEKRKKYDKYGDQWQDADHFAEAQQQGSERQSTWGFQSRQNSHFEKEGAGGFFSDARGTREVNDFTRRTTRNRGDRDVEYPLEVTLEEAYNGTLRDISIRSEIACSLCYGTGRFRSLPCSVCHGAGVMQQIKHLEVRIPAGVTNGSRVRIPRKGKPEPAGDAAGDLYLIISVKPHNLFERKDDDLSVNVSIPLTTAMLGGEVQVPTLKGTKLILRIPPETQNERVLRVAGQGMPHLGNNSSGSLLVNIKVTLPTGLSSEEKALFNRLKTLRPT